MAISAELEKRHVYLLQPGHIRAAKNRKLEVILATVIPGDQQALPCEFLLTRADNLSSKSKDSVSFKKARLLLVQVIVG